MQSLKNITRLLTLLAVVLITTWPLSELLVAAWNAEGLIHDTVDEFVRTTGVNIVTLVVASTGLLIGWLLLFGLDRSKRTQVKLLSLSAIPFLFTLRTNGLWMAVSWLARAPSLAGGIVLGFVSGAIDNILFGLRRLEFPIAVFALFFVSTLAILVGFVDLYVTSGTNFRLFVIYSLAAVTFVILFWRFVRYDDRRTVLLITPGGYRDSETKLLCSLFDFVEDHSRYDGGARKGNTRLNEARANLMNEAELDVITDPVEIEFKENGLLNRWIVVRPTGYNIQGLYDNELEHVESRLATSSSILAQAATDIQKLITKFFGGADLTEQINDADLVVFLVPLSDPSIVEHMGRDSATTAESPTYLKSYYRLCDAASGTNEVVVVATNAESAVERYADKRHTDVDLSPSHPEYDAFCYEIREWLGELVIDGDDNNQNRNRFPCKVIPVSSDQATDETEIIQNIRSVVHRIMN